MKTERIFFSSLDTQDIGYRQFKGYQNVSVWELVDLDALLLLICASEIFLLIN